MSKESMNKVLMVGGGKGGVGKTTVTIAVVDSLLKRGFKVVLVESDDSNPDTHKALNSIVTSEICNLDNEDGYIKLGDIIEANKDAFVVVNTAARATEQIIKHGGIIADVTKEQKRDLVMLWPINRQRDSIELLKEFLDKSTGYSATHVLKNTYYGAEEKFSRFDTSKQKPRVTETIVFPELNDLLADKLNDKRLALSNADEGLSIAERSVLRRYRDSSDKALGVIYG